MSQGRDRRAVVFVESNTSGTGRLFVTTARSLGFAPFLVTARPEKYAYLSGPDAPEVIVVPEATEEALHPLLAERFGGGAEIAGITSSSEYFIATAAALAARFGLPGPDAAAVWAARDKSRQREVLAAGGLPSPAFRAAGSPEAAAAAAREIGFPVVVKPTGGSGSVGVRSCADEDEVRAHAAALLAEPPSVDGIAPRVLVEERIEGAEFSVEIFGGRVIGITRKHLGRPPFFVEAGHDYPAGAGEATEAALADTVTRGAALLGLGWGPLHWELRVREGRAYSIEVNPRLAGGFIPELVRHAQGIDLIRATLRAVVGLPPELDALHHRHASIRFLFAPAAGRFLAAEGIDSARAIEGVEDVSLYRRIGDALTIEGDFRDRIGHAVARADTFEGAASAAGRARDAVRVVVEGASDEDEEEGAMSLAGTGSAG